MPATRLAKLITALVPILVAGAPACSAVPPPQARPGPAGENGCERAALGPGDHLRGLTSAGRARRYHLHVPPGYQALRPTPLVVAFHGHDSDAGRFDRLAGLRRAADREGFLLALPEGTGNLPHRLTWNAGACCGRARKTGADDVAFARDVVRAVGLEVCVDEARVFALGFSSGAMLAQRLACEAAETYVAVAAVAGTLADVDRRSGERAFTCAPSLPVSMLLLHGTADTCVPFAGGASCWPSRRRCDAVYAPIADNLAAWRARAGCAGAAAPMRSGGAASCARRSCRGGAELADCTVAGGGHGWPGSDRAARGAPCAEAPPAQDLDATRLAWQFFVEHPRPAAATRPAQSLPSGSSPAPGAMP